MKKILFLVFVLLISFQGFSQKIGLMTYNIRFDTQSDGEDRWDARKDFLAEQVKFYAPDVMGIQEGLHHQLLYLDSMLTDWSFTGVGRDDGKLKGEFSALFYNHRKLKMIAGSTFWLSETPEKPSVGWDAALERICTWALFEERKSRQQFYVFNTHFDHIGQQAREKSADLILLKIKEINSRNLPVFITGDFNLEPESAAIAKITNVYTDTWAADADVHFGPEGSFNGFNFYEPVKTRIDYIFTDSSKTRVLRYAILSDSRNCHYPSDHLPVYSEIVFTGK